MGKKMYYTEAEAAQKLGVTIEALSTFVRDDKLRVFQDGARRMYKAEEVDKLVSEATPEEEIELSPAEGTSQDTVALSDVDEPVVSAKEDTVITAEGISIFDEEDLEIEAAADPMAKTQIAPSLEDQVALEGVGSGSGLLDLTRESDDTSLGAEVLDHIDEVEGGVGSGISSEGAIEQMAAIAPPEFAAVEAVYVEEMDSSSGLFSGIVVGCAIVMLVLGAVMISAMLGTVPSYIESFSKNVVFVLVGVVFVVGISGMVGLFVGKSMAAKQSAAR